jgi:hypothetical protein
MDRLSINVCVCVCARARACACVSVKSSYYTQHSPVEEVVEQQGEQLFCLLPVTSESKN